MNFNIFFIINEKKIFIKFLIICIFIKFSFFIIDNNTLLNKYLTTFANNFQYKGIQFTITKFSYYFYRKSKILRFSYNIRLYNKTKPISPSDFLLSQMMSLMCYKKVNNNESIYSIPNIENDENFKCVEFFHMRDKFKIGINLIDEEINSSTFYIFNEKSINYHMKNKENFEIFDDIDVLSDYNIILDKNNSIKGRKNDTFKLSYALYPMKIFKRNFAIYDNNWYFANLYNYYFCFCRGKNCTHIGQSCKFRNYLNIIDINRYVYKKTDYLFDDLLFNDTSSDDSYPIFQEMFKYKLPIHYLTEDSKINHLYLSNNSNFLTIIPINKEIYKNYGDFVEKYLQLFLKLKVVISGKYINENEISKLFYNLDYINYIAIGHGICYFKDYLYKSERLYGINRNNKIVIPPSSKIIHLAKKYGWKDKDIIRINLPKWDIYNYEISKNDSSNSIFIMFTWRDNLENKSISSYYIQNIIKLLSNKRLNEELRKHNITAYFSLHRYIYKLYNIQFKNILENDSYIKFINQKEIFYCIIKAKLFITDFSSIIFDLIYRNQPIIMYVPDYEDREIGNLYTNDYVIMIESFRNREIQFENQFFKMDDMIDKIIYYINNNFQIEPYLKSFYKSFGFKKSNNIHKFIHILQSF